MVINIRVSAILYPELNSLVKFTALYKQLMTKTTLTYISTNIVYCSLPLSPSKQYIHTRTTHLCTSQSLLTYSNTISNWLLLSTTTANWVGLLNHPLPGPLSLACISHALPPPSPYPYASIYIQEAMHRHTTFFQTNDQILLESLGKQEGSEVSAFWIQKVEWFKWYCCDKIWTHGHTHTHTQGDSILPPLTLSWGYKNSP